MKALMHGGQHQRDEPVRVGELQVWDLVNETKDDRPGEWMYHCHILEHHAMGMMAHFELIPTDR